MTPTRPLPTDGSVTVVGASLAGLSAVRALREQGHTGRIVVVGEEPHAPYDRTPLSKEFLAGTAEVADLALLPPDEDLDVEWCLGRTAVRLDPTDLSVGLDDGSTVAGDGVVLATGARARRLPGTDGLRGVHVVRTLDDALALRSALAEARSVVVVGAGFIGSEVASVARATGRDVTVVEALPTPLAHALGPDMGALCGQLHGDHGVRLRTGVGVAAVLGAGSVEAVQLADGTRLAADVVVVGIGAVPDTAWLVGSGVELDGGVLTDAACATAVPGVVATGDCAVPFDVREGRAVRSEHWTHALQQPATAVATLLGAPTPYTALPYFWSTQYGHHLQLAGRPRPGDAARVVDGSTAERRFVATYERDGAVVAVLGMDAPKVFGAWRRRLRAAPPDAPGVAPDGH